MAPSKADVVSLRRGIHFHGFWVALQEGPWDTVEKLPSMKKLVNVSFC
jgi:hypothetical protein